MSASVKVCDVDPELKQRVKKFRFRKETTNAAIIMKIDKEKLLIMEDEHYEDISIEDLRDELSDHLPMYVLYSYCHNHDDGRKSYPLCFIYISPQGVKPELHMMYAGSKLNLIQELEITKAFELRSTEEFTEDWLKSKLAFFR